MILYQKGQTMPSRNLAIIRRDINRLHDLMQEHIETEPALAAVAELVQQKKDEVNSCFQKFQSAAVTGDKERDEHDEAITILLKWIQKWRPVILTLVPGADSNLKNLPSGAATPDDIIRVAEDMVKFINSDNSAASFRAKAIDAMGDKLTSAQKETKEAIWALPVETKAQSDYTKACLDANPVLVKCLKIVKAAFGPTSPEYKQFIARKSAREEDEIDRESELGEE